MHTAEVGRAVPAVKLLPMIEISRVWLALNLLGTQPEEVDLLLVQDLTLFKPCQSVTVGLQGLGWGHGLHPHTAATPLSCRSWSCTRLGTRPAPPSLLE